MSARKPKVSPRRKAGRAKATKPKSVRFRLVVEGQEMRVAYQPNWSEGEFAYGHFEFRSPHEPARRIPVSETGYLSHFVPMDEIATYAFPEDYARAFVLEQLARGSKRKPAADDGEQLALF